MKNLIFYLPLLFVSSCSFGQALNPNTNYGTNAGNSGSNNTSIGYKAGDVVTSNRNVFVGNESGKSTTSGSSNTFVGHESGWRNTTGTSNCFYGEQTGKTNLTGNQNSFFGNAAGVFNDSGYGNSFFGYGSGQDNQIGYYNSYFGRSSGENSMGNFNTFLGSNSGFNNVNGSSNIFIGYQSGYNESGSNKLYIENSSSALPLIYGDFSTDKIGINSLPSSGVLTPNTNVTLTVGGMINSTGLMVNGALVSGDLSFWGRSGNYVSALTPADNVGIGVILTEAKNVHGYKLAVNGKIGAKEIQIENNSITWSDFVFNDDYKLLSLEELERYIKTHKHLPEIPTEKEVRENGILVSEMNAKLLQKIEELTLHLIELKKEVEVLKKQSNEKK